MQNYPALPQLGRAARKTLIATMELIARIYCELKNKVGNKPENTTCAEETPNVTTKIKIITYGSTLEKSRIRNT